MRKVAKLPHKNRKKTARYRASLKKKLQLPSSEEVQRYAIQWLHAQ